MTQRRNKDLFSFILIRSIQNYSRATHTSCSFRFTSSNGFRQGPPGWPFDDDTSWCSSTVDRTRRAIFYTCWRHSNCDQLAASCERISSSQVLELSELGFSARRAYVQYVPYEGYQSVALCRSLLTCTPVLARAARTLKFAKVEAVDSTNVSSTIVSSNNATMQQQCNNATAMQQCGTRKSILVAIDILGYWY
jgi:hypothetical protein